MALVADARLKVTFELVDQGAGKTTRSYELTGIDPDTDTVADVNAYAAALWAELEPLTLCSLAGWSITYYVRETELVIPVVAQLEENLSVSVPLAGRPNKSHTFDIPAPVISLFQATSGNGANLVDPTNTDLLAFLDLFDAGSGRWMISDGEHIQQPVIANIRGKRTHKRSSFG